jgi:hypothetical protein
LEAGEKEALESKIERLLAKTHKLDAKGAQQGSALVAGEYSYFFNFLISSKKITKNEAKTHKLDAKGAQQGC